MTSKIFSEKCIYSEMQETISTPTWSLIIHRITFYQKKFMVCVVTFITISILNISPILNIQLHSQEFCECNCPFFYPIFYIVMPYGKLWLFFWGFVQNPKSNFIAENISFFEPPINGSIHRKPRTYWEYMYKPCTYQVCKRKNDISIF